MTNPVQRLAVLLFTVGPSVKAHTRLPQRQVAETVGALRGSGGPSLYRPTNNWDVRGRLRDDSIQLWFPAAGRSSYMVLTAQIVADSTGTWIVGRTRRLLGWRLGTVVVLALAGFFILRVLSGVAEGNTLDVLAPAVVFPLFFLLASRALLRSDRRLRSWLQTGLEATPAR